MAGAAVCAAVCAVAAGSVAGASVVGAAVCAVAPGSVAGASVAGAAVCAAVCAVAAGSVAGDSVAGVCVGGVCVCGAATGGLQRPGSAAVASAASLTPGTSVGMPTYFLSTTRVFAAKSPTRRCPLETREKISPVSGTGKNQGRASTTHRTQRSRCLWTPARLNVLRSTTRMPAASLPKEPPVIAATTTRFNAEATIPQRAISANLPLSSTKTNESTSTQTSPLPRSS